MADWFQLFTAFPIAYIPHGHCYLWQKPLVALHVTSDALIAISYFSIPAMLVYFVRKRQDTPFTTVFLLFGAFIASCGIGHLLDVWTLWFPNYWVAGVERAFTAFISCLTAIKLVEWTPQFLALRSPQELERLNQKLQQEIVARKQAQQTLKSLIEGTASATGEAFFAALVQNLAQALQVRYACVYEWVPSKATNHFLAVWVDGNIKEHIEEIPLTDNPCLPELQEGTSCYCPDLLQTGFSNLRPTEVEAKAYLGVPLLDNNGHSLGALCIAHDHSLDQPEEAEAIMAIFAARAAAELQRQRAELALRRAYNEMEERVAERTAELCQANTRLTQIAQRERATAKELEQAKNTADKANRAKSEFLATMSHELRTPLNAILGFTQIMPYHSELSERHRQYVSIINASGEHLLGLINNILEMSKIEAGKTKLNLATCNLHHLLQELHKLLLLKAQQKGLSLEIIQAPDVPNLIYTDAQKLRQVLLNLLSNSIKFTQSGRVQLHVTLASLGAALPEADITDEDAIAQTTTPSSPIALTFTVEDTGVGISEAELSKLFEAFQQTQSGRNLAGGTGLGLTISQQYVRLMGGNLRVKSVVDKGSEFSFTIPIHVIDSSEEGANQNSFQRLIGLAPDQSRPRILLVEDNSANQILLRKLLVPLGIDVREASNGEEAVNVWENWRPDLIWMDMLMPKVDGYEATRRIRAAEARSGSAHTFIIALTASAFGEHMQSMLEAGCDDVLYKPFKVESVLQMMQKYLGLEFIYSE